MKPYDEGTNLIITLFESFARRGMSEHELNALSEWVEDVLPRYLRIKPNPAWYPNHKGIDIDVDRLIPAIKKRAKQMGFG